MGFDTGFVQGETEERELVITRLAKACDEINSLRHQLAKARKVIEAARVFASDDIPEAVRLKRALNELDGKEERHE